MAAQSLQNIEPTMFEMIWEMFTFEMIIKIAVVYFFIIWIAVLVWVIKDISNRTNNIFLQIVSILLIVFLTPLWVFFYLLIRPGKTVLEKYYQEIEDNLEILSSIVKDKVDGAEATECHTCGYQLDTDFIFCPGCKTKLKEACHGCEKEIRKWWEVCPYCGEKQKNKKHKKKSKKEKKKKD